MVGSDIFLQRDVEECIIADMDYSRPMDAVRRNVTKRDRYDVL